jgi:O-antigen ligase
MHAALNKAIPWIWAAVWFTLPLSMKANGASLILFGLGALLFAFYEKPKLRREQVFMALLFLAFFAWHTASLLFDPENYAVRKNLERKLSFVFIPMIVILVSGIKEDMGKWAIRGFLGGMTVSGLHLLAVALFKMISGQALESYTYHAFTEPYSLGAIYYSFYLSAAIYYLALRKPEDALAKIRIWLMILFMILLLFCASKLFIILTLPALIYSLVAYTRRLDGKKKYLVYFAALVILIGGAIPFLHRVNELKNTDLSVVTQERYQYDTPLNGLTFRMVLWRFAFEIMEDENAWLSGTGIGQRQQVLNDYYTGYGIYTGNPDLGDSGYLGYNFHNQYLEVLVGTGIPGLILLLAILAGIFRAGKKELLFPFSVYILTFIFFMTESVLERQAGIVFFSLIWTFRPNAGIEIIKK